MMLSITNSIDSQFNCNGMFAKWNYQGVTYCRSAQLLLGENEEHQRFMTIGFLRSILEELEQPETTRAYKAELNRVQAELQKTKGKISSAKEALS